MNTKTVKNIFIVLIILAMAMMTACNLATPAQEGTTVEVLLDGAHGARGGGIGSDATWVSIKVTNSSGEQKGEGPLAKDKVSGVWKGKITVSETGQMAFRATAGKVEAQVNWLGEHTYNVGTETLLLTISVSVPAVSTAAGNGYGPAGGKVFYDKGNYEGGWRYLEAAPTDQSLGIAWSDLTDPIGFDAQGTAIGTGKTNTRNIADQSIVTEDDLETEDVDESDTITCTGGAAYLCDNLTLGGYDDWFLPSRLELQQLFSCTGAIPGLTEYDSYWTSTEVYDLPDYGEAFIYYSSQDDPYLYGLAKTENADVRAVRAF